MADLALAPAQSQLPKKDSEEPALPASPARSAALGQMETLARLFSEKLSDSNGKFELNTRSNVRATADAPKDMAMILRSEGGRVTVERSRCNPTGDYTPETLNFDAFGNSVERALSALKEGCAGMTPGELPPPVVHCFYGHTVDRYSCYVFPCLDGKSKTVNGVLVVPMNELSAFHSAALLTMLGGENKSRMTLDVGKERTIQYKDEESGKWLKTTVKLEPYNGRIIEKPGERGERVVDLTKEVGLVRQQRAEQFKAHNQAVDSWNEAEKKYTEFMNSFRGKVGLYLTRPARLEEPPKKIDWATLKTPYAGRDR
jgi:hypothetical protein